MYGSAKEYFPLMVTSLTCWTIYKMTHHIYDYILFDVLLLCLLIIIIIVYRSGRQDSKSRRVKHHIVCLLALYLFTSWLSVTWCGMIFSVLYAILSGLLSGRPISRTVAAADDDDDTSAVQQPRHHHHQRKNPASYTTKRGGGAKRTGNKKRHTAAAMKRIRQSTTSNRITYLAIVILFMAAYHVLNHNLVYCLITCVLYAKLTAVYLAAPSDWYENCSPNSLKRDRQISLFCVLISGIVACYSLKCGLCVTGLVISFYLIRDIPQLRVALLGL